ncbi:MAG: lipopolysaccharide assembly protein LapB [Gammaproteobacteria bacterium]|nr:lipopolysaccharide assembly protein LapB [Gammaproteobacteria bacterium]
MILHDLWLLLLPIAAASGWIAANNQYKKPNPTLPKNYLVGLNFLLNEEPDKAIDLFIKMLEVDTDTVETHLALGNLFRRRGEVDRAIRIHQNLTARPNLPKAHRIEALMALALDYLAAGVLDRAEKLFLQLIKLSDQPETSYRHLLSIYQQEKEWKKAIEIARKLIKYTDEDILPIIAHYYCELSKTLIKEEQHIPVIKLLKKALSIDKNCVRANLLLAKIYLHNKKYQKAIQSLKQIPQQDISLFSEAVLPLTQAYKAINKEEVLIQYFKEILTTHPQIPIVVILSEEIRKWRGDKVAAEFVADYVRKYPSVVGIHRLIELHMPLVEGTMKEDLLALKRLTESLLAKQPSYQCANCGYGGNTLHWQCPSCKKWGTVKPVY